MFTNSVLFEAGGVSFTLAKCFGAVGALLAGVTALVFVVLFKHTHGVVKRMSPDEAARAAVYGMRQSWDDMRDPVLAVKAVGAVGRSAEITFDIDSLRNAHRRGDRMTFWLSPILLTFWGAAAWLIFMAALVGAGVPTPIQILLTALVLLFVLLPWFAAWAAVYTNIDLGKAGTAAAAPSVQDVAAGRKNKATPSSTSPR